MELPAEVLIHNEQLGLKGGRATLLRVHPSGYYEATCRFGDRLHRVYFPIGSTVIIAQQAEAANDFEMEIER
ncbi:MAG TPA: hypothetical protein PK413_05020 [Thermoanaerobaculia bacterium]|nr:hypothetical protein [Thermoanaerobaculia bacterium]